jgi:hypothetical protein
MSLFIFVMKTMKKIAEGEGKQRNQFFKGYSIPSEDKKPTQEQHYVVPWELDHKDEKKLVF